MAEQYITIAVLIECPLEAVWKKWNSPEDIKHWNIPFDNWHCPSVENDVRDGGLFSFRMERLDGAEGFDYKGKYTKILPLEYIESRQEDGRKSMIEFQQIDRNTIIRERFQPEDHTPVDLQRDFCQSVLDRFKEYAEKDNEY